jgi:hypothetical protein
MRLDLHAVARFIRSADTETLLDRVTVYRAGMEEAALDLMEGQLDRLGVSREEIAAHDAARRAVCLFGPDGMAVRCDRCERPAVHTGWGWHRLWGLVPAFPLRRAACDRHAPGS